MRAILPIETSNLFSLSTASIAIELMLSILSGLAEGESASIAENNKWSIQKFVKEGGLAKPCPTVEDEHIVEFNARLENAGYRRRKGLAGNGTNIGVVICSKIVDDECFHPRDTVPGWQTIQVFTDGVIDTLRCGCNHCMICFGRGIDAVAILEIFIQLCAVGLAPTRLNTFPRQITP